MHERHSPEVNFAINWSDPRVLLALPLSFIDFNCWVEVVQLVTFCRNFMLNSSYPICCALNFAFFYQQLRAYSAGGVVSFCTCGPVARGVLGRERETDGIVLTELGPRLFCHLPFSWDNRLIMAKYYDVDDIITEEEVRDFNEFSDFWSFYGSVFLQKKKKVLWCCSIRLQPVSTIFQKAVNGVGIDPSSEKNSVGVSKFQQSSTCLILD